jgi:hypothetical protein
MGQKEEGLTRKTSEASLRVFFIGFTSKASFQELDSFSIAKRNEKWARRRRA